MTIAFTRDPRRLLKQWSPEFMSFGFNMANPTTTEAQQQAAYYELITARGNGAPVNYAGVVAAFKAARPPGAPGGKLIQYDLPGGNYTPDTAPDPITGTTDSGMNPANFFGPANMMPADLFNWTRETPIAGDLPYTTGAAGNYPPRPWDTRYKNYVVAHYPALLALSGMDGVQPDVCGRLVSDNMHQGGDNSPWHPLLKAKALNGYNGAWPPFHMSAISTMVSLIEDGLGGVGGLRAPCLPNGLEDGFAYFAGDGGPTKLLYQGTTGGMVEIFMRSQSDAATTYPNETPSGYSANWQQSIDMILDANSMDKVLLICTKLWPTTGPAPTTLQAMQWFRFTLASYLLATDGMHYWHYRHDDTVTGTATLTSGSNIITGTGSKFTSDFGFPPSGGESFIGKIGGLYGIASVDTDTHITLLSNVAAGDAGTGGNYSTSNPMHGRRRQQQNQYFATVPNYGVGISSGPNPDPAIWIDRVYNSADGTCKLGVPIDNYVQPISAQRKTGGGSAYYYRRFTKGLVIVNPTTTDVAGLDATAAIPGTPGNGAGWADIGGELAQTRFPNILSLTVPSHSGLIMTHN